MTFSIYLFKKQYQNMSQKGVSIGKKTPQDQWSYYLKKKAWQRRPKKEERKCSGVESFRWGSLTFCFPVPTGNFQYRSVKIIAVVRCVYSSTTRYCTVVRTVSLRRVVWFSLVRFRPEYLWWEWERENPLLRCFFWRNSGTFLFSDLASHHFCAL